MKEKLTQSDFDRAVEALRSNNDAERPFVLILNKNEWRNHPIIHFTEEELDNANEQGFIGSRYGLDCYITRFIKSHEA